jgi:hypothetical protein
MRPGIQRTSTWRGDGQRPELPVFDCTDRLVGEVYHQRLAAVRQQGWLTRSPLTYVVLTGSRASSSAARRTAFPGREIAEIFG